MDLKAELIGEIEFNSLDNALEVNYYNPYTGIPAQKSIDVYSIASELLRANYESETINSLIDISSKCDTKKRVDLLLDHLFDNLEPLEPIITNYLTTKL